MSVLKKLAGQTAIYGLSSIVGRLLNYFLVPIYTRVLPEGEYGISNWFYAFAAFAAVIFTYGMETAFFRFTQKATDDESRRRVAATALISLAVSAVGLSLLLIAAADPLATWTRNEGRGTFFVWFALILGADALTTIPFAWLRQQNQALRFASLRLLSIGVNILLNLIFYLVLKYKTVEPMFWANVASSLVLLPFFVKEYALVRLGFDKMLWKAMFLYAFPLIFMGFAGMINETLDRMLLKWLITDQVAAEIQTGIYGANYKLSILITLFIQAFRMGAEPFFFARANEGDAPRTYARVMHYFVIVCAVIFLGVMLYLDVFQYFIGEKYRVGLKVVPILLMANVFLGMYYNLSVWYKIKDKTALGAWVSVIGAVITLILNILWIPKIGYIGSAWATLICYLSMVLMSWALGQKHYPVPYPIFKIVGYLSGALIIWQLVDLAKINFAVTALFGSILMGSVGLLFFGILIFWLEKDEFLKLLGKKS